MAKFFKNPFASSGDRITIPEPIQGSGAVSYIEGFGFDYERDQTSDPLAKAVPRDQSNELFYQITLALQQYQTNGFPDFITSSDNGGTPYSYGLAAYVRYDDGGGYAVYESIVSSNTSLPTDATKWRRVVAVSPIPVGTIQEYDGSTLPAGGWIWANGQTIGNAASGATGRANADTLSLFTLTWNSFANSERPLQDSSGAPVARGISAAADFAANRRIPIRDKRDVVSIGLSTMGGTTARGLVTNYRQGVNSSVLGATGGEEKHTPIIDEMADHGHPYRISTVQFNASSLIGGLTTAGTLVGANDPNSNIFHSGGGEPFNIMQPTTVTNFIIKL